MVEQNAELSIQIGPQNSHKVLVPTEHEYQRSRQNLKTFMDEVHSKKSVEVVSNVSATCANRCKKRKVLCCAASRILEAC